MAQPPAGWKTIKDKSGACQMAVPSEWKVSAELPSTAQAPDNSDATVIARPGNTVKPMGEPAQQALMIDKMIENTPQRVFYADHPTKSAKPLTGYHVTVPGKGGTCVAMITMEPGHTEDEVKKIATTLSVAK